MTDEELMDLVQEIYQDCSNEVIEYIGNKLDNMRNLSNEEFYQLMRLKQFSSVDLNNDINKILNNYAEKLLGKGSTIDDYFEFMVKQNIINVAEIEKFKNMTFDYQLFEGKVTALKQQLKDNFRNFSKTTVFQVYDYDKNLVSVADLYQDIVNKGVLNMSTGAETVDDFVKRYHKNLGKYGLRVKYASGINKRLDSAMRMNIRDTTRAINQNMQNIIGEQLGCDGVEISAHHLCAEDHVDIQGKQFTNEEFDKLQASLKRPIGTWNCRHFVYKIVLGITTPNHDNKALKEFKKNSSGELEIFNKTRTKYEWSQQVKKLELDIRYLKDSMKYYKAHGLDDLAYDANLQIKDIDKIIKTIKSHL